MSISVLCPVECISVYAKSQRLDDLGQFTKYVLWAIGEGYSSLDIKKTIELSEHVVEEEILYLHRIGFIDECVDSYRITETGKGYLDLISAVNKFNKESVIAQINWFTGGVSEWNSYVEPVVQEKDVDMPYRMSKYLILNNDYPPLTEFIHKKYPDRFRHLRDEFRNSISLYIKRINADKKCYRRYFLDQIPDIGQEQLNFDIPAVRLEREYAIVQCKYRDERLARYRTVADTLVNLNVFERELLSDYAQKILGWFQVEKRMNESQKETYFDLVTGEQIEAIPSNNNVEMMNRIKKTVVIPSVDIYTVEALKSNLVLETEEGCAFFEKEISSVTMIKKHQVVPFSYFEEEV